MRKCMTVILLITTIILTAISAGVAVPIEYWAGSGANEATCVIDFGLNSYAFGYRWDAGSPSGFDMIQAIDTAGSLDLDIQNFGFGAFINGISYNGDSHIGYGGDENWWHYWTSENGADWDISWSGASDRTLTNGTWDGWGYGFAEAPDVPGVPEPSSIMIICSMVGLTASTPLLRRRKK